MKNFSKQLIIILVSMMLIGCGFELQNTASFTGKLETLYIKTADPYTIFYRTIKRQMANHGVEIVTESDDSNFVIIIFY